MADAAQGVSNPEFWGDLGKSGKAAAGVSNPDFWGDLAKPEPFGNGNMPEGSFAPIAPPKPSLAARAANAARAFGGGLGGNLEKAAGGTAMIFGMPFAAAIDAVTGNHAATDYLGGNIEQTLGIGADTQANAEARNRLAAQSGELVGTLGQFFLPTGKGQALATGASRIAPWLIEHVPTALAKAAVPSVGQSGDLTANAIQNGATTGQAEALGLGSLFGGLAANAAPISIPGKLLTRAASGLGIQAALTAGQQAAQHAIAPNIVPQVGVPDFTDPNTYMGAALAALFGPRSSGIRAPDAKPAPDAGAPDTPAPPTDQRTGDAKLDAAADALRDIGAKAGVDVDAEAAKIRAGQSDATAQPSASGPPADTQLTGRSSAVDQLLNRDQHGAEAQPAPEVTNGTPEVSPRSVVAPIKWVDAPNGTRDFGAVNDEIATNSDGSFPAAPIRLAEAGTTFGHGHISDARIQDFKDAGYANELDALQDVATHYTDAYEQQNGRLLLVKRNGRAKYTSVELQPQGDHYSVTTWSLEDKNPKGEPYEERGGRKPLFHVARGADSGGQSPFGVAGNDGQPGNGLTLGDSGDASVPDAPHLEAPSARAEPSRLPTPVAKSLATNLQQMARLQTRYMGNKAESLKQNAQWESRNLGDTRNVHAVFDWYGGGGTYGLSHAIALKRSGAAPRLERVVLNEIDPRRAAAKARAAAEGGDMLDVFNTSPRLIELKREIERLIGRSSTPAHDAVKNYLGISDKGANKVRFKALRAKHGDLSPAELDAVSQLESVMFSGRTASSDRLFENAARDADRLRTLTRRARNAGIRIEHTQLDATGRDAIAMTREKPGALVLLDPPYHQTTEGTYFNGKESEPLASDAFMHRNIAAAREMGRGNIVLYHNKGTDLLNRSLPAAFDGNMRVHQWKRGGQPETAGIYDGRAEGSDAGVSGGEHAGRTEVPGRGQGDGPKRVLGRVSGDAVEPPEAHAVEADAGAGRTDSAAGGPRAGGPDRLGRAARAPHGEAPEQAGFHNARRDESVAPRGMPAKEVDRVASGVLGMDAEKARVHAVDSFDALPEDLRAAAAKQGVQAGDIDAVHFKGHSYILADQMRDADAVRKAVFHELYTHGGLRAKYGNRLGDEMDRLSAGVGGEDGILRMAREQDINLSEYERAAQDNKLSARDRRLLLMEELLAHMSKATGKLRRIVEEWLGTLRAWLRRQGLAELSQYNAADLALVLKQARQAARESMGLPADKPMFHRAYETAPDSLMGFRKNGQNTPFHESKYRHVQPVRVTFAGDAPFTDAVKGLNQSHAIERARRNWPGAKIEPITDAELRADERNNDVTPYYSRRVPPDAFKPPDADANGFRGRRAGERDQTDTPAFRNWFKDSKAVDADGKPLTVYHGTSEGFNTFDNAKLGTNTGHMTSPLGHFLTEDRRSAKAYADKAAGYVEPESRVIDAHLSMQNPKEMTAKEFQAIDSFDEARALRAKLEAEGYDGIHIPEYKQWVAFKPEQIKSASQNRGTFDPANPDIRFSRKAGEAPDEPRRFTLDDAAGERKAALRDMPALPQSDKLSGLSGRALHDAARADFNAARAAGPVHMMDGADVQFTSRGWREASHHAADRRVLDLIPDIRELMENAVPLFEEAARDPTSPNTKAYRNYAVKVAGPGGDYFARFVVRVGKDGRFHYDHDTVSVEAINSEGPAHQPGPQPKQGEDATSLAKNRLAQWWNSVNDEPRYQRRADDERGRALTPRDTAGDGTGTERGTEPEGPNPADEPPLGTPRAPGESMKAYGARIIREGRETMLAGVMRDHGMRLLDAGGRDMRDVGRGMLRAYMAGIQRNQNAAEQQFKAAMRVFDGFSRRENLDAIHQWETKQDVTSAPHRLFFAVMDKAFKQRIDAIHKLDPTALQTLIQNYFPHLWKDPTRAAKWYASQLARKPLQGDRAFLKQRVYATIREGMAAGLEPISANPVDLFLGKLAQMDKFIAFGKLRGELDGMGWLHKLKSDERVPYGYARVDNGAFGGVVVPETLAKDINNYLSPGITNKGWRALRWTQNTLTMAQLGWSGFHAGFTTFDNAVLHAEVGLRRAVMGDFKGAIADWLHAPLSVVASPIEGGALNRSWVDVSSGAVDGKLDALAKFFGVDRHDANTLAILDALEQGGARWKMSRSDYTNDLNQFLRAFRQKDVKGGVAHALGAFGEAGSFYIHHVLVPNQKMAARVLLAKYELDRLAGVFKKHGNADVAPGAYKAIIDAMDPTALRQVMGKVVHDVDSRLGQMAYDNLFWSRGVVQIGQTLFRALGWQIGTVGTVTGGVRDLRRLWSPEKLLAPLDKAGTITGADMGRLTGRTSYLLTLAVVSGLSNALLQYALTGEAPSEPKDFFFPKTGRKNSDGSDERLQLPSYWMDHWKIASHPLQTLGHKINPIFEMVMEPMRNQDFWGAQIRDPHAKWDQQAAQLVKYWTAQFLPFTFSNGQKVAENGGTMGRQIANFFGVTNAPTSVTRSQFQAFVGHNGNMGYGHEMRTQADLEHSRAVHKAESAVRAGETPDLTGMTARDRKRIARDSRSEVPELMFNKMNIEDKLQGWEMATPKERDEYRLRRNILKGARTAIHTDRFMRLPETQRQAIYAKLREIRDQPGAAQ